MISAAPEIQTNADTPDLMHLIAHELRQPLSTIGSIAYYLTLILPRDDQKIHEQLARLQQLVEQSSWILSNGQQLTETPGMTPEAIDLDELILDTIAARSGAGDAQVRLDLKSDRALVKADPLLARALLENILMLFRLVSNREHPATIRTMKTQAGVTLEIATSAPGFRSETALGPGGAMSLECARRIVKRHGGTVNLNVDASTGIRMLVMLP